MTGSKKRYGNAGFAYHQINWCTFILYRLLCFFSNEEKKLDKKQVSPLMITGLFRSGTTITAKLLKEMGFSVGPEEHLLLGKGWRRDQNPDGFLENYLFMELSMYLFYKTNSWGDAPPQQNAFDNFSLTKKDRHALAKFSLLKVHDDRISNLNKIKILARYNVLDPSDYIAKTFGKDPFIKNPHFSVQYKYFKRLFPASVFLFVFKEPAAAIQSAKVVSPKVNYDAYDSYYSLACEEHKNGNNNILFFSHENLCRFPELSIEKLAANLRLEKINSGALVNLVNAKPEKISEENIPEKTRSLYQYMFTNCLNSQ